MVRESSTSPLPNQVESPRGRSKSVWHILRRIQPFDALRILLGSVLLIAAGLKGYQLATEPTLGTTVLESRWFLIALVEFELLFGIWLIAGLYPKQTRYVAISCFTVFAGVSLAKAVTGHASCGCFGNVPVSPWFSFAWNVVAVGFLCLARQTGRDLDISAFKTARCAFYITVVFLIPLPIGVLLAGQSPGRLGADGKISGSDQVVLLEPDDWVGQQFPLLPHIEIAADLSDGDWTVVFYRHGCPDCDRLLQQIEVAARLSGCAATQRRFALIQLPPHRGRNSHSFGPTIVTGQLRADRDWFCKTPTVIELREGVVVRVASSLNEELVSGGPQ